MAEYPEKLTTLLDEFSQIDDRNERAQYLIELADEFEEVPQAFATRPFPEANHVQRCESDAYVWAEDQPDGTLKYYFAVENPQGLSARAMAVILDQTLSGEPLEQVAAVPCDIVHTIFGKDISMGKGQGLMGMVLLAQHAARQRLANNQN